MAMKRRKGAGWEYCIQKRGVLARPQYLRFADEAEGDAYVARLEKLLDAGVVPPEFAGNPSAPLTIRAAIDLYLTTVSVANGDERELMTLDKRIGPTALSQLSYEWVERWVKRMKQVERLSPSTIRHRVGALARLVDWLVRRGDLPGNPLRLLPRTYASYTSGDAAVLAAEGKAVRHDTARERRLEAGEEAAIRRIFDYEKPEGKERALSLHNRDALLLLFDLALETAMRLREMFTLDAGQVDLPARTIYLDKTKNGDSRQVPLSSVAAGRLMGSTLPNAGLIFPWWNGDPAERELRRVTALLSRQFARIFEAAGCGDLHFHDLRHEATSRLFERTTLSDFEIAKITGHRSPRMLMRYANLRGSNLAAKLW